MFMHLDVKVCEEPRRSDHHERRVRVLLPEQRGEFVQRRSIEVVRNDKREALDPLLPVLGAQHRCKVPRVSDALDTVVQFAQERYGLGGAGLADTIVAVEEEVVACISGGGGVRIEDGEVADAGEDEVLEDGGGGG